MTDENLKPMPDRDILGGVHSEITLWYDRSGSINLHKSFGIEYPVRYTRAQEPTGDAVEALSAIEKATLHMSSINPRLFDIVRSALRTPAAGNAIPSESVDVEAIMRRYDAGLLGGSHLQDADWWQDYIRAELDRAHDFYQAEYDAAQGLLAGKIPSGYALVPIEPDDNYAEAICLKAGVCGGIFESVHSAMLAAAPSTNKEEAK